MIPRATLRSLSRSVALEHIRWAKSQGQTNGEIEASIGFESYLYRDGKDLLSRVADMWLDLHGIA